MEKRKKIYLLALIPFLVLVLMYEIIPLLTMIADSVRSDETGLFSLENYRMIFSKLIYQKALWNSMKISLKSSLIGIVVAFLGAQAAHAAEGKLRGFFMAVLNMVSNFAGVPLAFAYMILLGNAGVIVQIGRQYGIEALSNFNLYTTDGISLVYVYFQIPLSTLLLFPAFYGIRKEWKEASQLLGAGSLQFWTKIGIPVLMPSIMNTLGILFANALAAYATVYALMMSSMALLPVQISGCFVGESKMQRGMGGALSVVMMGIMVLAILVFHGIGNRFQKGAKKS